MTPVVTAEEMRAAEAATIAAGTPVETLMERAGTGAAEAVWRFAAPLDALVVCGPGNNGGDGYVIARALRERGVAVRVAALAEPRSGAARLARDGWQRPVERLDGAEAAPLLVDALFGTGLARPLDQATAAALARLAAGARTRVAVDLPSGVATDDGRILSPVPDFDLTVTFGAYKPSHLLQPAARHMGRIVVADIGIDFDSRLEVVTRPRLRSPGPDDHKYSRGYVALAEGEMPGAAALTASAAARAGAGYVRLIGPAALAAVPRAIVQGGEERVDDPRIDVLVVGPGLGRGAKAQALLERALASRHALVLDADALALIAGGLDRLDPASGSIITPHAGEFARLFGDGAGSKVDRARAAAAASGAVVLFKGSDTVIAAPDGRAAIAPPASAALASAGTGDVLTGVVAAMRAGGLEPFQAACAAAWIHGRAAEAAGPALIADDLLEQLPALVAACR